MSAVDELERGRALSARGAWLDAHAALTSADRSTALQGADVERLATSAYMLGRLEEYVDAMARAHQLHLDAGAGPRAARCAFWAGMSLLLAGEMGRGTGWIGRAQRLVDGECVEQGYLRLPDAFRCQMQGDYEAGAAVAADAAAIAQRFGDRDLFALAVHAQGTMLIRSRSDPRRRGAAGRGDGGRHERRGVADPLRHGLLRRDPRLPRGVRARPRPRVDGGADAVVRGPARHGGVHRSLPRAPRRGQTARGSVGGRARRGPAGRRSRRARQPSVGPRRGRLSPG